MTDAVLEAARANYTKGLQSVIDAMRQCSEYAETYMAVLNDPESAPHAVNGTLKRKRGKGKDADEEAGGKRKRVKDPNAPKRPASSYIIFQNNVRQALKQKHPDLSPSELRTLISQEWSTLKDEDKEHYKKEAEAAKVKYTAQKAAYAARSPEEVAAPAVDTAKEKAKRGSSATKKAKSAAKVVSRESTAEPDPVPVQQQTSSAAISDDSSEEAVSEEEVEEVEDEVEDDEDEDEEEEEEPAPKKTKVIEKPILRQSGKKSK
ncbi:hypothetical protein E1B28_003990 [Marasmius oreades]|uniref:HMG box domain-containing protein n=1 Tax=Marasmius oreades TaxID=181124 RepID=A0A9P8AC53_9AGAR|nr:uncharacterized protein E1B28_003990 [Marasmius oreades]KAG7096569.1 hypothetical protein E1B28_003990 [Marasmius oreades]